MVAIDEDDGGRARGGVWVESGEYSLKSSVFTREWIVEEKSGIGEELKLWGWANCSLLWSLISPLGIQTETDTELDKEESVAIRSFKIRRAYTVLMWTSDVERDTVLIGHL